MQLILAIILSGLMLNFGTFMVNGEMIIFVRYTNGDKIPVEVGVETTIGDVKHQINMKPLAYLTYDGRTLTDDTEFLADLGICDSSVIEMNERPTTEQAIKYLQDNYFTFDLANSSDASFLIANLTTIKYLLRTNEISDIEQILHLLIISGFDLNALPVQYGFEFSSLLTRAILEGCSLEIIRLLVLVFGLNTNGKSIASCPLVQCAYHSIGSEIALFLIDNGADINFRDEESSGSILDVIQLCMRPLLPSSHLYQLKQIEKLLMVSRPSPRRILDHK